MVKRVLGHNALDMLQFAKPSLVSDTSMVILTLKQECYQALPFDLTSASATPLLGSMQRLELSVLFYKIYCCVYSYLTIGSRIIVQATQGIH